MIELLEKILFEDRPKTHLYTVTISKYYFPRGMWPKEIGAESMHSWKVKAPYRKRSIAAEKAWEEHRDEVLSKIRSDVKRISLHVSGEGKTDYAGRMSPIRVWDREPVSESSIDFPQEDLDVSIWDKDDQGRYTLRTVVRQKILDILSKYPDRNLRDIAKEIHIVGSLATNQYTDDADIDVHVIPKDIELWSEDDVDKVIKWFNEHRDEFRGFIESHPIEVYVQLDPNQDLMSDGCYDLSNDEWLIGPKVVPMDTDPYSDFSHIADDIRDAVESADVLLGELKRDVIDYDVIKQAMERMPGEDKEKLLLKLQDKLDEIEDDIETLYGKRKEWVDARRKASKPATPEQALEDVELAKNWKDVNATFKFINRYHYLRTIKDLQELLADEEISSDEVDKIKSIMGV